MDFDVSSKTERRGILCGMLLGNAGRCRNNFYIQHSTKQLSYVLFKKKLLEDITGKAVNSRSWLTKEGYELIRIEPRLSPLTRVMVKRCYKNNSKTISQDVLRYLTLQGIAIWFMDDGAKSFKKRDGRIRAVEVTLNTYLSKEENEVIIAYFEEKWGVKWGLNKSKNNFRLRMGTREARKFFSLIEPYILPSIKYKVDLQFWDGSHLTAINLVKGEGIVQTTNCKAYRRRKP
jgi:hypothetical protein